MVPVIGGSSSAGSGWGTRSLTGAWLISRSADISINVIARNTTNGRCRRGVFSLILFGLGRSIIRLVNRRWLVSWFLLLGVGTTKILLHGDLLLHIINKDMTSAAVPVQQVMRMVTNGST
jgi:hypothetical protein